MRGVGRLALAAQGVGDLGRETAEGLALGVDDEPVALAVRGFGDVGLHSSLAEGVETPREGRAATEHDSERRAQATSSSVAVAPSGRAARPTGFRIRRDCRWRSVTGGSLQSADNRIRASGMRRVVATRAQARLRPRSCRAPLRWSPGRTHSSPATADRAVVTAGPAARPRRGPPALDSAVRARRGNRRADRSSSSARLATLDERARPMVLSGATSSTCAVLARRGAPGLVAVVDRRTRARLSTRRTPSGRGPALRQRRRVLGRAGPGRARRRRRSPWLSALAARAPAAASDVVTSPGLRGRAEPQRCAWNDARRQHGRDDRALRVPAHGAGATQGVAFDFAQTASRSSASPRSGPAGRFGGRGHQRASPPADPLVAAPRVASRGLPRPRRQYLVIDNEGTGTDYAYMHLREAPLRPASACCTSAADRLRRRTGAASGCHLHFESGPLRLVRGGARSTRCDAAFLAGRS